MKRFVQINSATGERSVKALFRLRGDRVEIEALPGAEKVYGFREIAFGDLLTPADGARYFNALEHAFLGGYYYVETLPDDAASPWDVAPWDP